MVVRWSLLPLVGILAACQTARVEIPFDPTAAAYVLQTGTGRIEGEAFVRRDFGRIVTAAGERVYLIPATTYTLERFDKMFSGDRRAYWGTSIEETPPEYERYRREAKVDMRGRFVFDDLAPGRYIVATRVFWTEPNSYIANGGAIYDVVEVKPDATTKAIVSGK
jgi:hypothetical protein